MPTHLPPPRIAAVHDLSCLGRCALTVIIPTLSVMGFQVVPLPTALLSTHTGGYTDLHFRDLTEDMSGITAHFSRLGTSFASIYSGFLGSAEQIEVVSRLIDDFGSTPLPDGKKPLVLVDPVMGDEGALYSTYTDELVRGMRHLATKADLITPNLTEACFLTEIPYRPTAEMAKDKLDAYLDRLMRRLEDFGTPRIVITGIPTRAGELANLGRNPDGSRFTVSNPLQAPSYPGTGDIFASVLLGSLLAKNDFEAACRKAADFISELIRDSSRIDTPVREGVALEPHLHLLCK